jgi:hypothetical protein
MTRSEVSQYLMKAAFALSLFFIVEYCLSIYMTSHLWMGGVVLLLKCVTPVALYYILRRLRQQLPGAPFPGLVAWSLGVRVMLFAALPEAAFIYVYHQFIDPSALCRIAQQTVQQLESLQQMVGADYLSTETIDLYRQMEVPTAIETAVNTLSQDVMIGIFLMLIIAPIVRRKGTVPPTPSAQ